MSNPGLTEIQDISVGDRVLTHTGEFQSVSKIYSRHFSGRLISIKTRYYTTPFLLTPEHPVLIKKRGNPSLTWVPASEIRPTDYVAYPIITKVEDRPDVSTNLMGLIGYYLAEGDMPKKDAVRFSFGVKETSFVKDVIRRFQIEGYKWVKRRYYSEKEYDEAMRLRNEEKLSDRQIAKKLGIPRWTVVNWIYRGITPLRLNKNASCKRVTVTSEHFANIFKEFGSTAENKRLPMWALWMPIEKQSELVKCYWRGDGDRGRDTYGMVTASATLAHQLRMLLLRLSIISHITVIPINKQRKSKIDGREIVAKHTKYQLRIGGKSLHRFSAIIGERHPFISERKSTYHFARFFDKYVLYPVANVTHVPYDGEVRNLEVQYDQSYALANVIVHNCDADALLNKDVVGNRVDKSQPIKVDVKRLLKRRIEISAPV